MKSPIISHIILGIALLFGCIAQGYIVHTGHTMLKKFHTELELEPYPLNMFNHYP